MTANNKEPNANESFVSMKAELERITAKIDRIISMTIGLYIVFIANMLMRIFA